MSATIGFIAAAAGVLVVVLAILLRPLWRSAGRKADARENNLDLYRDQLDELERDRAQGSLAEADFAPAKAELQRRLLDETAALPAPAPAAREPAGSGRRTAYALIVALPLAAFAGYALLGTPAALDSSQAQAQSQEIDALLDKLVQRLKANPDDSKGWVILARSYKALGRYDESATAFAHASALVDGDAALLADYAETLATANGGSFDGKPDALIARALALDPDAPLALFLAGSSASDRKDYAGAVKHWERLLPQLTPGSEDARSIGDAVTRAREILAKNGVSLPPARQASAVKPVPVAAAAGKAAISGEVAISARLKTQAKGDDLLFIFARAAEGSRMPIAVVRTQVAALPTEFRLDDTMSLPGGQKLSEFKTVTIEARVAKAGMAQSSSGDLYGRLEGVKVGSDKLRLVIDQVQP